MAPHRWTVRASPCTRRRVLALSLALSKVWASFRKIYGGSWYLGYDVFTPKWPLAARFGDARKTTCAHLPLRVERQDLVVEYVCPMVKFLIITAPNTHEKMAESCSLRFRLHSNAKCWAIYSFERFFVLRSPSSFPEKTRTHASGFSRRHWSNLSQDIFTAHGPHNFLAKLSLCVYQVLVNMIAILRSSWVSLCSLGLPWDRFI